MNNIGQQLQEARSRLGYSLSDVSDAIHIRAEYLGEIEENTFDINLPKVYIRGFVRLYAKFLKLDPDEIVDSFNKRNAQLEFGDEVKAERENLEEKQTLGQITRSVVKPSETADLETEEPRRIFGPYTDTDDTHRSPWIYVAGIGAIVILLFAAIFVLKLTIFAPGEGVGDPTDPVAQETSEPITEKEKKAAESVTDIRNEVIGLIAKGPVYLYVNENDDKEILFTGELATGEKKIVIREGEIVVACDKAENLIIERGGVEVDLGNHTGQHSWLVK